MSNQAEAMELLRVHSDTMAMSMNTEWTKKKLVWIPSEKEGFLLAAVVGDKDGDETIDVELLETGERQRVSHDDVQKPNPPKYEKCEDMSMLTCLNEASVLHNLRQRYYSNLYYTYSGLFCVVINPYKQFPIYTDAIADNYKGKKRKEVPPHIFAVADEAYRSMLQDHDDQSILCTGESGAGKTENTKKVIQYLAHVAGNRSLSAKQRKGSVDGGNNGLNASNNRLMGQLEEQLLQANPILEAFGNSKTVKNDNSSRFGKFIRVLFDRTGCISGANIEFYLLEKSRVLRQSNNERCFHIFYQMLKGASKTQKDQLLLEGDPSSYKFLTNGNLNLPGVDDAKELKETRNAMSVMGISDDEVTGILKIVSAVLLFGNLEFTNENKNSDQAALVNDVIAQKISNLLGVNFTDLVRAFVKPKFVVQRDHVVRSQTVDQVEFSVGAIAKACYERLFRWLVQRLNKSLDRTRQLSISFIGILDIAGFEIFDVNSFEQLCINYTNEKLQQLFNNTMFVREQQEYLDEGIEWKYLDFGLNLQPTIELIEKPMGIISTLDDVCLFPQGSDANFVQKLTDTHSAHPKFVVPEMRSRSDFAVVHYAGRVDYQAKGWRVKNMDPLNDNVIEVLRTSKESIFAEMWKDVSDVCSQSVADNASGGAAGVFGGRVPKKGMFRTVSQLYKEQLGRLMSTLANTNPHFVRCIIPNHEKKHGHLNAHLVLDQLRCNGVLEGIRICRQGYPTRLPFQEFRNRYEKMLAADVIPKGFMDGREAVQQIVKSLEIDKNLYRIGRSKVFFRVGVIGELEEMRDQKLTEIIIKLQSVCRGHLARRQMVKKREQEVAVRILQRNFSAWMRLREWQWWRLLSKLKPVIEANNKEDVIAEREQQLHVTTEKLRRSEMFLQTCKTEMEKIEEERFKLKEKLEFEAQEKADLDEERTRALSRKNELELALDDMAKRLETEEHRAKSGDEERRKLIETIRHLEESLEDEEKSRQKLLIEKNSIESKLKELELQSDTLQESGCKLSKEKKSLEDRCQSLSSRVIDEEEKTKQLSKTKTRLELAIKELTDELEHERQQRATIETAKRAAENALRDEQESSLEHLRKAEDISALLTRKEAELTQINMRNDEELAARQQLEREVRELRVSLEDATEDLKMEKTRCQKAEKAHRDLAEELENYKRELEESNDKSELNSQMRAKREEEYTTLQKQLADLHKTSEDRVNDMKQQTARKLEELTELLDASKRQHTSSEKARNALEQEKQTLSAELASLQSSKSDTDKKRKAVEAQLTEREHQIAELNLANDQLLIKYNKAQTELEAVQTARDTLNLTNSNLLKKIATLDMQLNEMTYSDEEARRNRENLNARIRKLEDELALANEQRDEAVISQERAEREATLLRSQLVDAKKRLDDESVEKIEEIRRKADKDLATERERADAAEEAREKAERAKKKAVQEAEDVQNELSTLLANMRDADRKQRKFDQQLLEERNNTSAAIAERDGAQQLLRESETRQLMLTNELTALKDEVEQLEKERRVLKLEVDNLASTKDDAGKSLFELEKVKRRLEEEVNHAEQQIAELEDALQMTEDAKARLEVNFNAARADFERQLAARDQDDEDRKKSLSSQNRNLQEELDGEKRAKAQLLSAKKKLEAQLNEQLAEIGALQRQIEELNRQGRKSAQAIREIQAEAVEARSAMDEALMISRETEKRARSLEEELKQAHADVATLTSIKRKLEMERDELHDELQAAKQSGLGNDERRRLEAKIADYEDLLEEETSSNDLAQDKLKKAQVQVEQLTTELTMERNLCERTEAEKTSLDRAVRELKQQLQEAESHATSRMRSQLSAAEAKVNILENQLAGEEQERLRQSRILRRLESRLAETTTFLEDEKRQSEQHKIAADRLNTRLRQIRNQMEEAESERDKLRQKLKEERRRCDDLSDTNESLTRDLTAAKTRQTYNDSRRTTLTARDTRRFGSNTSISRDDMKYTTLDNDRPASRLTSTQGSQMGNSDDADRENIRS